MGLGRASAFYSQSLLAAQMGSVIPLGKVMDICRYRVQRRRNFRAKLQHQRKRQARQTRLLELALRQRELVGLCPQCQVGPVRIRSLR